MVTVNDIVFAPNYMPGANNTAVAVGDNGSIRLIDLTSNTYETLASGTTEHLKKILTMDQSWIVIGNNDTVIQSVDKGVTLTPITESAE